MRAHAIVAVMLFSLPIRAQSTVRTVSGVVFDSTVLAPLAGAVVQAVRVSSDSQPGASRTFTAIADANGRFHFDTLPAGRFAIGFQHSALNAFGLDSPVSGLEWTADSSVIMDLALSSSTATRAQLCGGATNAAYPGVLGGFAVDAHRGAAPANTKIVVQWFELGLNKGKLSSTPHEVVASPGEGGVYLACNLPTGAPLAFAVSSPGYHAVESEVTIPDDRIVQRRDVSLAENGLDHGSASVVGRVSGVDGAPLTAGFVALRALDREVSIENGTFTFANLPGGTWTLDVRAIGYEPVRTTVAVADAASTTTKVVMTKRVQTLEVVNVVGKVGRDVKILEGIQQRMLTSHGTYFGPGNEYLAYALFPGDVVRAATGFSYKGPTKILARAPACSTMVSNISKSAAGVKHIAIYLDGMKQPGGLETVANMIPMKDVLAIEAYPEITSAPFLWRTNDACAVIAIWSKPQF